MRYVLPLTIALTSPAFAESISLTKGKLEQTRNGARQWVRVINPGPKPINGAQITCTFYKQGSPVEQGVGFAPSMPPGDYQDVPILGGNAVADSTVCRASETNIRIP